MKHFCFTTISLCFLIQSKAQIYIKEGKNRYTFAQTTIGYNMDFTPIVGYSYKKNKNDDLEKFAYGSSITPVISITGLHFWGHAEFFTGFSLPDIKKTKNASFSRSAGTGAKVFPLKIRTGGFSPYIGFSISGFSYKQDAGTTYQRVEYPILLGLSYSFNHGILEVGTNYYHSTKHQYYISKDEIVPLSTPRFAFSIDYKYFFDFSIASHKRDLSGETKKTYEKLKRNNKLNSFSLAAGPAYSFMIGKSSYNTTVRPYLDDYTISPIFPDIGIGYYHYNLDAALNISYRSFAMKLTAFDVEQRVKRRSVALEAYKFLTDYHGFVPFVGGIISREHIQFTEIETNNVVINSTYNFWTPGIIMGWDIRPTRVDWWSVRTNLRYFPFLQIKMPYNKKIDLQQIELNFLQLVIYPNRFSGHFVN